MNSKISPPKISRRVSKSATAKLDRREIFARRNSPPEIPRRHSKTATAKLDRQEISALKILSGETGIHRVFPLAATRPKNTDLIEVPKWQK